VHLSILLIFVGTIIGARFGFDGFLNLHEGGESDVVYTNAGERVPLGFTIKCNWYNTDYYTDSDTPQEFRSELVIFDGGREVLKKVIEVNHPLKYKGITFYQASYGMIPDAVGEFILKVTPNGGQGDTIRLQFGESFEIPNTNIRGTIVDFSPALGSDPITGKLITYTETMVNPAVAINFEIGGSGDDAAKNKFNGWFLKRYPEIGILPGGHKIEFVDYWGVEYTGLQVSRDPGVGLIYFAFTIMTLGLYVALFMSHKKIWVSLTPDTSGKRDFVRISIGGSANKNRFSFEKEIEKILSRASRAIEERSKK
jgi:cytochrome c biogenesis protein